MNFVAVTPIPVAPRTMNIPMVERMIPSSPNMSFPKIRAHKIPDRKKQNFPIAVPVNVQKAPCTNLLAISCFLRLSIILAI